MLLLRRKGYTLADRGTYLALKKNLGLDILVEGDAILLNIYHVIEVNPAKWPKVNVPGGKAFADFMVSKETKEIIKTFGVDKFGSPLFFPDAGKKEEELGKVNPKHLPARSRFGEGRRNPKQARMFKIQTKP